jgi:hypothetical protein
MWKCWTNKDEMVLVLYNIHITAFTKYILSSYTSIPAPLSMSRSCALTLNRVSAVWKALLLILPRYSYGMYCKCVMLIHLQLYIYGIYYAQHNWYSSYSRSCVHVKKGLNINYNILCTKRVVLDTIVYLNSFF